MIPPVELLVHVEPGAEQVTLVARTPKSYVGPLVPEAPPSQHYARYLGGMDGDALLKTARLFIAAAVGEATAKFILDCIEVGAESSEESVADAAMHAVAVMRPVEEVPA